MTGFLASAAVLLAVITLCHDRRDVEIARVLSVIHGKQALTTPPAGDIAFSPGEPMIDPTPGARR